MHQAETDEPQQYHHGSHAGEYSRPPRIGFKRWWGGRQEHRARTRCLSQGLRLMLLNTFATRRYFGLEELYGIARIHVFADAGQRIDLRAVTRLRLMHPHGKTWGEKGNPPAAPSTAVAKVGFLRREPHRDPLKRRHVSATHPPRLAGWASIHRVNVLHLVRHRTKVCERKPYRSLGLARPDRAANLIRLAGNRPQYGRFGSIIGVTRACHLTRRRSSLLCKHHRGGGSSWAALHVLGLAYRWLP